MINDCTLYFSDGSIISNFDLYFIDGSMVSSSEVNNTLYTYLQNERGCTMNGPTCEAAGLSGIAVESIGVSGRFKIGCKIMTTINTQMPFVFN